MTTDNNDLKQQIDLGFQVQAFLGSELGQYLIHRAEACIESAVERLKVADPEDSKTLRAIQNEIRVAESVQYWLADAITAGQNAEEQFLNQNA